MQWGWSRGKPPPSCRGRRSMSTALIARCPVAMGWGVGVYSPFFLALVSLYQVTMVEPGDWRP